MKKAIISDIHSNLEALGAVLEDIDERGDIEEILCCGDIVGYGPDPNMCLKVARSRNIRSVMGNHDFAAISARNFERDLLRMKDVTKTVFRWTYNRLSEDERDYLKNLPFVLEEDRFLVSHGSVAEDHLDQFKYIETNYERFAMNHHKLEQEGKQILFYGHRHIPGIYPNKKTSITDSLKRDGKNQIIEMKFKIMPDISYLVNVGAVGQPRDGDPRACYVVYDENFITIVKVEYDFRETQEKIMSTDLPLGLRKFYARRLELGK